MPEKNGTDIPAAAMAKARLPLRRIEVKSSSRPTRKRKNKRPMLDTDSSIGVLHEGKIRCEYSAFRPKADGPRRIPPCMLKHN
ncbi:hypothetical protein RHGRI_015180 [Rhododendron griersonianum]|uniref:Uncharacterized protein n=1 Tax=Rhododendron griersonianum TaxID=479676 RepID=A0AAV6KCC5_9ERIC|nr:hypothetical protein RHGRI_015180 [Rhododendron griersonianum]